MKKINFVLMISFLVVLLFAGFVSANSVRTFKTSTSPAILSDTTSAVFIYDAGSESWNTCDDSTSWHAEKGCFPDKVLLVGSSEGLDIIDLDTNTSWMNFVSDHWVNWPNSTFIVVGSPRIAAKNGLIVLTGGDDNGLWVIDFPNDYAYLIHTDGTLYYASSGSSILNISQRAETSDSSYTVSDSGLYTVNTNVNDVAIGVFGGKTYISAPTDGGLSILNLNDGITRNHAMAGANDYAQYTAFDDEGNVYYTSKNDIHCGMGEYRPGYYLLKTNYADWVSGDFSEDAETHLFSSSCKPFEAACDYRNHAINDVFYKGSYLYVAYQIEKYNVAAEPPLCTDTRWMGYVAKYSNSLEHIETYDSDSGINGINAFTGIVANDEGFLFTVSTHSSTGKLNVYHETLGTLITSYSTATTIATPSNEFRSIDYLLDCCFAVATSSGAMIFYDGDGDGIVDSEDTLIGHPSSITKNAGLPSSLTVKVDDSTNIYQAFSGEKTVNILHGSRKIADFDFTFGSENKLDLTSAVIKAGSSYIVTSGLDADANSKTLYLPKRSEGWYGWVCVKDAHMTDVSDFSGSCVGEGEVKFDSCHGGTQTIGSITCTDDGTYYAISGLTYSGGQGGGTLIPEFHEWVMIILIGGMIGVFIYQKNKRQK